MKIFILCLMAVTLAGCTSLEKQQSHEQAQVKIVSVQREAMAREMASQSQAQIALYENLARIAEASPESSDAIVLAMALVGNGANQDRSQAPIIALQERRNEAIELTKALAPTVGGVLTSVGLAAINANVSREQVRATRDVSINDSNNDARIVEAVSGLGVAAVSNVGDNTTYNMSDSAFLNNGENIHDSYNTTNTEETNTTTTTTTTSTITETVTYGGQEMTLESLLAFLQSTGKAYELTIGSTVYTIDGDGQPETIDCSEPQFSPAPPECSTT